VEVNIAEGEPGLEADNTIVLDNSEDEDLDSIFVQDEVVPRAQAVATPAEDTARPRAEGPSVEALQAIAALRVRVPLTTVHLPLSLTARLVSLYLGKTGGKKGAGTT
jgi:hypothetical protein